MMSIKNWLLEALFPSLCLACGQYLEDNSEKICRNCLLTIELNNHLLCPVCHARVPSTDQKPLCHPEVKYLLSAASDYGNPAIQAMIKKFKYDGWQGLAGHLVSFMNIPESAITSHGTWSLLPIPLYPSRYRQRGFNQAELLANKLGRKFNLAVIRDNLARDKNTRSQAELTSWQERERNIADAFSINDPEILRGRNIILIDDVYTSGATLNEAARVLKLAGVNKIIALVVANAK